MVVAGKKRAYKVSRVVDGNSTCGHGKTNAGARRILVVHILRDAGARVFLCGTLEKNATARGTRVGHFFCSYPAFFTAIPVVERSVTDAIIAAGIFSKMGDTIPRRHSRAFQRDMILRKCLPTLLPASLHNVPEPESLVTRLLQNISA